VNPDPGGLTVHIDDRTVQITMTGGGDWSMPIGPLSLVDGELERADRPSPAQLTNALGIVADHFDDVILDTPMVAAAPSVSFSGRHALEVARVEVGSTTVPDGYVLQRADANEVFRTLVGESIADRRDNPGLDPDHVESIIGTCCVILAIVRRLDLQHAYVADTPTAPTTGDD
jgi:exopolyphosphatase / guanosine-5'-triphosphate,3'-diphosphate pyrophosphatase